MSLTLNAVFEQYFSHVKFDAKLAKAVYKYQIGYVNKNHEHLEFFGSNLLGVHVVRFKDSDVAKLYDEVFDVDYLSLTEAIRQLDTITHEWKVTGDILNLTLTYVIHKFLTSGIMNEAQRKRAAYDTALIFFYRCIAALLSYYFKYPCDHKIAQAAYANLSNKYLIKKLGSWHKVMDYRANDLIDKNSIHYEQLLRFNDDTKITYIISDAQGRIRDLIKNYYSEFKKVHTEGDRIATTSGTFLDIEGNETVKEKTKSTEGYISYMRSIINDKHSFKKENLIGIISRINTNTSTRMIKFILGWLSDNYSNNKYHNDIDEFLSLTIVHSLYLIENNLKPRNLRDYPHILGGLKSLYLATRSTDVELERIRELGEKLIKTSLNNDISLSLLLSTRTSIILYITLRALVGKNS